MQLFSPSRVRHSSCKLLAIILFTTAAAANSQTPVVYDAVADFSVTNNPNGAWSYGFSPATTPVQFTPYNFSNGNLTVGGQWHRSCCEYPKIHGPQQLFGDTSKLLYLHPSGDPSARLSILRWTAPASGTFQIAGQFTRGNGGRKDVAVRLNGTQLASSRLGRDGETLPISGSVNVNAGDQLDFTSDIADDGQGSDSTGIRVRITQAAEDPLLRSAGRDLARNEVPDRAAEVNAVNASVPEWSYGYRNSAAGTAFTLFTAAQHTNSSRGRAGNLNQPSPAMQGWDPDAVVLVNTGLAPVLYNYGFGPLRPIFPGQMFMHPSQANAFAVARWTAPAAGSYRILAKWFDLDAGGGNGASAHVVINGKEVFGRKVPADSVGPERFVGQEWENGGNAAMPATTFKLHAGDVVDFALGSRGNFAFDSTSFNAAIRRVPTVTLTEPSTERIAIERTDLQISAAVSSERPVDFVKFELNGKHVRRDRNPPYEYTIQDLAAGTYYLTAIARDATGVEAVSEPVKVTVLRVPSNGAAGASVANGKSGVQTVSAAIGGGKTYFCTQSGVWQNPETWGGEGVPGRFDDAVIPKEFAVLTDGTGGSFGTEVNNLDLAGSLTIGYPDSTTVPATTVYGVLQLSGSVRGGTPESRLAVETLGKLIAVAGQASFEDINFDNVGETVVTGDGGIRSERSSIFIKGSTRLFPSPGTNRPVVATFNKIQIAGGQVVLGPWTQLVAAGAGNLIGQDGGSLVGHDGSSLIGQDGSTLIGQDGSTLIGQDGSTLLGPDGGRLIGLDGSTLIGQDGSTLIGQDGGSLISEAGSGFGPRMSRQAEAGKTSRDDTTVKAISRDLRGITLGGGHVGGFLNLIGHVLNQRAFLSPGNSPGKMRVFGDYTQEAGGTLLMEVAGAQPGEFDQLEIGGTARLGGNLIVNAIDGFTPQSGDVFAPLTYSAVSGSFANVSSNAHISLRAEGMTMQVSGPNPPAPKALNIATRMRVETGDNVLIAGFIVTGSQPKRVLIRGIGPSLPVEGALADPTLDLDGGAFFNDDWKSDQEGEIAGTTIPPSSDLESAIVATLEPGAHTAVLRGNNDGTGVGLVEVYDLESGTPAQLANISTRGQVQTGDNVMIGGFIIGGNYPAKVLLRAVGPSLPVEGALQNPTLELVDGQGNTITNDNWRETQESEIIGTTVPPSNDNEAAIAATLVPGAYTAVVRGKEGTVGVALVEGYNLQ